MTPFDRNQLVERAERLTHAAKTLKQHFVGIDQPIDELIEAMRVWYIMPQALTRPVIINLWGMTGVGKTDLIRRLIRVLELQERFVEVELNNDDDTRWYSSVESVLRDNHLDDAEPKVVLFDEVQRFRTIDADGDPLDKVQFSDFWELLSDGQLSRRDREDVHSLLFRYGRATRHKDEDPEPLNEHEARQIKRTLGLKHALSEIVEMSESEIMRHIANRDRRRFYEPVDHSKTLIIISGNLDEAYTMAGQVTETDVDADIFCAFTDQVTLVQIKRALAQRFKPEQVARFGNIHILYRGLDRAAYTEIIQRELNRIIATTHQLLGLELVVSQAVADLIYRNGVFPVQGVRPVFSSIGDILECNLSHFLLHAVTHDHSTLRVDYSEGALTACFDEGTVLSRPYVGRIDKARNATEHEVVCNVAVHEAGHALLYLLRFSLAPLQLVCRSADAHTAGFTFPHRIHLTRQSLLDKVAVLLAGGLAEELVFGAADTSTGRAQDREQATALVIDFVRRYGFHDGFRASYTLEDAYALDHKPTDAPIEHLLADIEATVRDALVAHRSLLEEISAALIAHGTLGPEAIAALAQQHQVTAQVEPEGHLHVPAYASRSDRIAPRAEP